jgi:type II secretory ATPase GspE/PulE/Tfp pilus assembly ATPase PilB-like protein
MDTTVTPTSPSVAGPVVKAPVVRGRLSLYNETVSLQTLLLLPQEIAGKYKAVVFRDQVDKKTKERTLSIATINPAAPEIKELAAFLQSHNSVNIDLYEATQDEIEVQLSRYIGATIPQANDPSSTALSGQKDIESIEQLEQVVQSAIIPSIVTSLVSFALKKKSSDVHIEPLEDSVRVRYRVDGLLITVITIPRYFRNAVISRIKILSQMKIDEQRVPQDGRFEIDYKGHAIDIRVSTLPTVHGEKVVMRLLDKDSGIITLEQLGVTGSSFDALVKAINHPYGVILSTGPTGSGKSTTLYAVLNRIARPDRNVVTLEDPVEYEIDGVNQSQVKPAIGYSFAEGLRSILRQDPNIIMVGEVRDLETASLVTHAALTGHLVLTTLHTNDSAGALPRLINMGVEPFLLTSSIRAVVAQRLVRKLCVACRRQVELPKGLLDQIHNQLTQLKGFPVTADSKYVFYEAVGCNQCTDGYSGRSGIFEVLTMSETIESLAVSKQPSSVIAQAARQEGMITLKQDGILKALKGITTIDEVWRVTTEA